MKKPPKDVVLIRRFFDWLRDNPLQGFGYLFLIFIGISICFVPYRIQIGYLGVVRRFGKYDHSATPGLNFKIPWGIDRVTKIDVDSIYELYLGQSNADSDTIGVEFFTGDENLVGVQGSVQFQIGNAPNFLFNALNPEEFLMSQLQEILISIIGDEDIDSILSARKEIVQELTLKQLESEILPYHLGIKLLKFNLDAAQPPPEAEPAFIDVIDAREDQFFAKNTAEIHKVKVIAEADGMASRIVDIAQADAFTRVKQAGGAAARFAYLLAEYQKSPNAIKVTEYYKMAAHLISKAEVFVLGPHQGASLEVNLLDRILPYNVPEMKEKNQAKGKQGPQQIQEILLPETVYEQRSDRAPGYGGEQEGQPMHVEPPTSTVPIPLSEIEEKNAFE